MKKYIALFLALLCAFALAGCSKGEPEVKWARIPMVMVDGVLYLDTGFTNHDIDDGAESDGEITSQVDGSEEPTENDQSNFGTGYKYRYGETEGTVDIYLNGKWRIFATEEARHKLQFPENDEEDLSEIPGAVLQVVDIYDRAEEKQLPCDEALELFYEDETNEYYFSCIKSHYIMVMDSTGRTVCRNRTE
ncbi:MAG: hypothetical protein IJO77_07970 [Oscillospiraceae bacterium]|nr:hypothetical protein [Oscillospiraceae bacterium]